MNIDENLPNVVNTLTKGRDRAGDECGRRQRDAEVDGSLRSRRNDEGRAEAAELTERNGCDDSCEEV